MIRFLRRKCSHQICKTKILLHSLKSNQKLVAVMNNFVLCENVGVILLFNDIALILSGAGCDFSAAKLVIIEK